MPRPFKMTIHPPLGGTVRKTAFQDQPPFTAYDSSNMWPTDNLSGRKVFATRPPLQAVTNPGGIVTMGQLVNGVRSTYPFESTITAFNGSIYVWDGDSFAAATGAQAGSVDTTRPVYATTYTQEVFISESSAKPIVFDYSTGAAATLVETAGTCPSDARILATWQGAIWLAGQLATPHVLYGSRVGDPKDFDFAAPADDEFRAFFSTIEGKDGLLNGPITALAVQNSDTMIVSTYSGLTAMRGHPLQTGIFDVVSDPNAYIMGQGAWCKDPNDVLYWMSPDGLYMLEPSANAVAIPVSKKKMPETLLGLIHTYANPEIAMAYDSRWGMVLITVRGIENQAWAYDPELGGFHRMEFTGYPHVMWEFPKFITINTSGVLWGGVSYGNLARFDKFGDEETVQSSAIFGPIPLAETVMDKTKVQQLHVVLGRDTPGENLGILGVAVGADAQDAVNVMQSGASQFITDTDLLDQNNGVVHPQVSGNAMVIGFTQGSGSLSIEQIGATLYPAGYNRRNRTDQAAIGGVPTELPVDDDFDPDTWVGMSCATPIAPTESLTDFTHWVDLSRLPDEWWANAQPTGADVRATTGDGETQLPVDVIYFDSTLQEGFLAVKLTQTVAEQTEVCLWVGNPNVGLPDPDSEFGQYNAYDENWKQFLPSGGAFGGGEEDRTSNLNHITLVNQVDETCLAAGAIGTQSTDYAFIDATNNYGRATASVPTSYPATFVVVVSDPDTTSLPCYGLRDQSGPTTANIEITANRTALIQRCDAGSTDTAAAAAEAQSGTITPTTDFTHFAAVIAGAASRTAYLDGGNAASNTTTITIAAILDEIIIGKGARSGLSASSTTAKLCLAQVHNIARSAGWVDYQEEMLDQEVFWGEWSDFEEVNPPEPPEPPNDTACPLGFVPVVEVGTWSGYAHATPQVFPTVNYPGFTHYVDLANMPAEWWAAVDSLGVDIRVTNANNVFIPFDLIDFDSGAETGFLTLKIGTFVNTVSEVRLWVGNAIAVTVPPCATYGQYETYGSQFHAFWPQGAAEDRTQNQLHLTGFGTGLDPGGAVGPAGNSATTYNGTSQYSVIASSTPIARTDVFAMMAAINLPTPPDPESDEVILQADDFRGGGSTFLHRITQSGITSSLRFGFQAPFGSPNIEPRFDDAPALADVWHSLEGVLVSNQYYHLAYDGTLTPSTFNSINTGFNITRVHVGASFSQVTGDVEKFTSGTISLVVLRRPETDLSLTGFTTDPWADYTTEMYDQTTFWGTWTWVAEVSSLPQP